MCVRSRVPRSERPGLWLGTIGLLALALTFCTAPSTCTASEADAFEDESIVLALVLGISGLGAQYNEPSLNGVRLAVAEINERGGVLGKSLELVILDNMSTPIGSKQAVEKADAAKAVAIVGPAWSSNAIAAGREAQKRGIPMVSNVATNPAVTRAGDYVFRVCFTDDFQGRVLAMFARNTKQFSQALTFVDITSDYSIGLEKVFRERFESLGGTVLARLPYKVAELKQRGVLDALIVEAAQHAPDVIFLPTQFESGTIVRGLREIGMTMPVMGGDGWDFLVYNDLRGYEGEGAFHCAHWSPDMDNPKSRALVEQYDAVQDMSSGFVLAYDAVYLVADALQRAGSTDRVAVRDALAATRAFEAVTGTISFDSFGDPLKSAVIIQVQDGKPVRIETVSPAAPMP
jgi:branched-chain amino acid transport system substrate-binding protein